MPDSFTPSDSRRSASPTQATTGLTLDNLACERSGRLLFSGLTAHVEPGWLLRVEGANGAGKTSLLRMICGLLAPRHGRVLWQGQVIRRLREEFGAQLLFLGHLVALKDEMSALENLHVNSRLNGLAAPHQAVLDALGQAGLAGRERVPVRLLSQGQRRRAALARLLLGRQVPLWVLDEPFNALDKHAVAWLLQLLAAQVLHGGIVVLTSHQSVTLPETVPVATITL